MGAASTNLHRVAARALIAVLREHPLTQTLDTTRSISLTTREQQVFDLVRRFRPYKAAWSSLVALLRSRPRVSAHEAGRTLAEALPGVPVLVIGPDRRARRVRRGR